MDTVSSSNSGCTSFLSFSTSDTVDNSPDTSLAPPSTFSSSVFSTVDLASPSTSLDRVPGSFFSLP